jgi:hypothetical protein
MTTKKRPSWSHMEISFYFSKLLLGYFQSNWTQQQIKNEPQIKRERDTVREVSL